MLALYGNGVGAGIAIGRARIITRPGDEITQYTIDESQITSEVDRLELAFQHARNSLKSLADDFSDDLPEEVSGLVEAHVLMLDDPTMLSESAGLVRSQRVNAEFAVSQHGEKLRKVFAQINDPYISSKSADVSQVIQRVIAALAGSHQDLASQPEGAFDGEIIVANDLTPADTVALRRHKITGFVTNLGGPISHTAILARSMKIPAIVGLHGGIRYLRTGDQIILDGKRGVILASPDANALAAYARRKEKIIRRHQALETLRDEEAVSLDGCRITLMSNVELLDEVALSQQHNAEGIGLYRTEFLFMNRDQMPDEEEQLSVYRSIIANSSHPVTIRTLDLGADKQVDGGRQNETQVTNPALGLRAIRLCLSDLSLFKPQLRAIFRASAHGNVRMMVPMLSNVEELDQLFRLVDEVKGELSDQGVPYDADVPIGGMIEVPAAAIAADIFAHRLDFLSIGTNDLIQYTLAIDRIDDDVNYLYDPLHPSILRLIKMVIDAGNRANIPVAMCGEMAGDPEYTRVLLALGLREFSMDPTSLLEIKQKVRVSEVSKLERALPKIMSAFEPEELRRLVKQMNQ